MMLFEARSRAAIFSLCLVFQLFEYRTAEAFLLTRKNTRVPALGGSANDFSSSKQLHDDLRLHENDQRSMLLQVLFNNSLTEVTLTGQAKLKTTSESVLQDCAVLVSPPDSLEDLGLGHAAMPALLVPLTPPQLKLLQCTAMKLPQSKWTLISSLNPLLVNRDGALCDNIPWAEWTVDPQQRNRDASNNIIATKYHSGKRDAYNRFLGKDWAGSATASVGLLRSVLDQRQDSAKNDLDESGTKILDDFGLDQESQTQLARRIWEIQYREAQMDLAEIESNLAVATQQARNDVSVWEQQRNVAAQALQKLQAQGQSSTKGELQSSALDKPTRNAPPYRGASGYDPAAAEDTATYRSPYDLLKEIIKDQLQAEMVGAVLEISSLLQATVGGALVIRRISAKESISIAGETLSIDNTSEDYGNPNVTGRTTIVVECDADEAIGMALACDVPLHVETELFDRASVMCQVKDDDHFNATSTSYKSLLRTWRAMDSELSILKEGQYVNQSKTERVLAVRSPRSTSLFDAMFAMPPPPSSPVFPTDNPVKTLNEYDALSVVDKAQTLQSMSGFNGRLPRPRVVREKPSSLDELLIPLVDESVRRQYLIRDAKQRGDTVTAAELESRKSQRQVAKERADFARDMGKDDEAEYWENEANFLETLRADATQDEGAYSEWLDRDEWYERQRLKLAKRVDKKKLGTLLDGIDF
ncbi:hypothetical protein MPSEU_001033700 [Mayamaea pseudoterrestris]|nr:hypothetical protein MPSEU_001033700 [Mayamaea pseudoterrestris]